MTREEYINYPAISASRIKRHYTGDISHARSALDAGASFHYQLLETPYNQMTKDAQKVYEAIHEHQLLSMLFDDSDKELIVVSEITFADKKVLAKGMMDICWKDMQIIADVKTTSAKNVEAFAADMIKHINHVQAVWYSNIMGYDPANFYYIGVPPKVKRSGKLKDLYLYRHNAEEIDHAYDLIETFINQFDGDFSK
jgi:hypothetical protein